MCGGSHPWSPEGAFFSSYSQIISLVLSIDTSFWQGHLLFLDPWLVLSSLFLTLLLSFLILSMGGFCYGASDVLFCLATVAFTVYLILTVASYRLLS